MFRWQSAQGKACVNLDILHQQLDADEALLGRLFELGKVLAHFEGEDLVVEEKRGLSQADL